MRAPSFLRRHKVVLLTAVGLYAGVFCAGAYAGWQETRQTKALVRAALPETYIARNQGNLYLQIRCAGRASAPEYEQRLSDNRYNRRPSSSRSRIADAAIGMANNSAVQTVVLGAAGSEAYRNTLKHFRQRAFLGGLSGWRARGQAGAIILAALTAYPLGRYLFSRLPPACGSEAALSLFEEQANRVRLAVEVFLADERRLDRYVAMRQAHLIQGPSCAIVRSSARATEPDVRPACAWLNRLNEEDPYLTQSLDEETRTLRGADYSVDEFEQLARRCREAREEAGTDVCLRF